MTDETPSPNAYDGWLAKHREVCPPPAMADRIMTQVTDLDLERRNLWWLQLLHKIEGSRMARLSVCAGAMGIGGLPFLIFTYVPSF